MLNYIQLIIDNLRARYWNMGPGNEGGNELRDPESWTVPHLGNYTLTPVSTGNGRRCSVAEWRGDVSACCTAGTMSASDGHEWLQYSCTINSCQSTCHNCVTSETAKHCLRSSIDESCTLHLFHSTYNVTVWYHPNPVTIESTLCLKKASPTFSAVTRESIVGFS